MTPPHPTTIEHEQAGDDAQPTGGYLARWRRLSHSARLYLVHSALLTSSLAISGLFFNLLIEALGYPRSFLGLLNTLSIGVAAGLSVPLWWVVSRINLRWALTGSAALQALGTLLCAVRPQSVPLLIAVALTGAAAVLFQISAAPFMMQHSNAAARDHLFSANAAINVGLAGVGSLVAGGLPTLWVRWFGFAPQSAAVYRASFAIAGVGLVLSLVPLLLIREPRKVGVAEQANAQPRAAFQVKNLRPVHLLHLLPPAWRDTLRQPTSFLPLLVPPFLISCGAALLFPYLNLFFREQFTVADVTLGRIFAALGIVTGAAALLGPLVSARIGKLGTIMLMQALSLPFLLTLGFVPLLGVAVGAALVRGALFNMGAPLYDAFAMERTSEAVRPMVIGLINGAYSVGYLVAPQISTTVQTRYGWTPLFVTTAMCYSLAVVCEYWFFARTTQAQTRPTVS